jgi:hypothetical protein
VRVAWLTLVVALEVFAAPTVRRFALVAGENRGLGGEESLRYAKDDARRMRDALVEVGQVAPDDVVLLEGATAQQVRVALTALEAKLSAEARANDRLLLYVSGHAGDGVLHLDDSELPLSELVDFLKRAPVEVGVLIVDACRSGAMTRMKGLRAVEGEPVKVEASGLKGRVLISASGADEYAQESDALKGSTFTHHLVTGLRGAADVSGDGRVTLDEVYAWAWARTIESTFGSRGGVQRPSFKVDLSGNGPLVLSEPGAASGRLTLSVKAAGRWLVVAADSGAVVAELDKPLGPMTLALPAGGYRVRLRVADGVLERSVVVPSTGQTVLSGDDLERASLRRMALKGRESALTLSAGATVATGVVTAVAVQVGGELRARFDVPWLVVNELTASVVVRDGQSVVSGFRLTEFEPRVGAGHRFFVSRASLSLGLELGAFVASQTQLPDGSARLSLAGVGQLNLEGRLPIVRPVELYVLLSAGGAAVNKQAGVTLVPRASGSVGVALAF